MPLVKDKVKVIICGNKEITEKCLNFMKKRKDTEVVLWVRDSTTMQVKQLIQRNNPDFIFSIQHEYLIPKDVLEIPTSGCINLHFGLLPEYGGCYPIAHSILNNEDYGGFTLHEMNEEFDKGPVIHKQRIYIKDLVAVEAYNKIVKEAFRYFTHIYPYLISNTYSIITPDPKAITRYYKKNSINFKEDSCITSDMSESDIMITFRAFTFPKYQRPKLKIGKEEMTVHNIVKINTKYEEDFLRNITVPSLYDTYLFENIEGKTFLAWIR